MARADKIGKLLQLPLMVLLILEFCESEWVWWVRVCNENGEEI